MGTNEPTDTTQDPAALPFGAPFAAWVKDNVTPNAIAGDGVTEESWGAIRRALYKHAQRRGSVGLGDAMEDMVLDGAVQLRECARRFRDEVTRARSNLDGMHPLRSWNSCDPSALHAADGAVNEAVARLSAAVVAYAATAEKLAVIGDEERARVAVARALAREKRRETLIELGLAEIGRIAAQLGITDVPTTRKAPLVDAILAREFQEAVGDP